MNKKILLIDDDKDILQLIKDCLENYDVTTAMNGEEALDILEQHNFDLIITDIIMPKEDGIGLILKLKKLGNCIPVIVMSGNRLGKKYLDAGLQFGAVKVLEKPFNIKLLIEYIEELI